MNAIINFFTDTATLAGFDPMGLTHRVADTSDWWTDNFLELEEVRLGAMALIDLGSDGVFRARITDGDLTPDEHDYAAEVIRDLGLEVTSNAVYVGPGECLPGGGFDAPDLARGIMLPLTNGAYKLDAYAIQWSDSPR